MDRNELAEWLERMSVVAEEEGFRSAEFHVDKLREIAAALRESEGWRRDADSGEEWLSTFIDAAGVEYVPKEHANQRLAALQARIDALMLESGGDRAG